MPKQKRHKCKGYPGCYFIMGKHPSTGKPERIFYITYYRDGSSIEEKAGRQYVDKMSAKTASIIRVRKVDGLASNKEMREQIKQEKLLAAGKLNFAKLWKEYVEVRGPEVKGLALDQSRWRCYLEDHFGAREPAEVTQLEFDRFRLSLLKAGKSPQTVKNTLELLRRIWRFGASQGLTAPPAFDIRMPRVNNIVTEFLSPDEFKKLMDVIDEWQDQHLARALKLAYVTGMRRGEIINLEWRDIDFRNSLIHIRDPKGGADQSIPLNIRARQLLKEHPRGRRAKVFHFKSDSNFYKQLREIRQLAQLPAKFRMFHGARHHFASALASSGKVDLYTLQKLLTHKNPRTTTRYAALRDEALKKASNVITDIFTEAGL